MFVQICCSHFWITLLEIKGNNNKYNNNKDTKAITRKYQKNNKPKKKQTKKHKKAHKHQVRKLFVFRG